MRRHPRGRIGGVLCATLAAIALALGWSASGSVALPAAEELVPNTVARVSDVPDRTGTITKAEFRHGLVLAAVSAGLQRVPKPGGRRYEQLERRTLNLLLEAIWIRGQAAEMGISVTPRQVSRELTLVKKEVFRSEAEYRQFLRESRYTRRDVRERVELQMLATRVGERLQRRIEREARNKREEQEVIQEFVTEFNERWRSRTVCAPEYATERCSNGPTLA
jgi:hypothetical protein